MKVYGVSGLPGSGKSVISRIAKKEGIHTISMGDVIRNQAQKNNCTTGEMAVKLRKQQGNNVVAKICVQEIYDISNRKNNKQNNNKATVKKIYNTHKNKYPPKKLKKIEQDIYIIEGIRSTHEVNYFKKHFKNFKVIAIHSSPKMRFNRLKRRKRSDDSNDINVFHERDNRELNFGIGNVIALADYMLINDGPIQKFKNDVRALIENEIKLQNNTQRRNKNKNKNKNKKNRKHKKGRKQHKKHDSKKSGNKQRR